jgi:hypothetical protein
MTVRALVLALLVLAPGGAGAHKPSDAYLSLTVVGASLRGQWDIALRDLEQAIGLDGDGDGRITWGEVRAREAAISAYALGRIRLAADGVPCPGRAEAHLVDEHSDGAYAVLRFTAGCEREPERLRIEYDLLFDLDPQHRGLLRLESGGSVRTVIFAPDRAVQEIEVAAPAPVTALAHYAREGVRHVSIGVDHVLFLLCLLLPAVLQREAGAWRPAPRLGPALADVLRVVTAFTVAHSITLTLAALHVVRLSSRFVESAIAASVVLAALNNVWPLVGGRRWAVALGFGLVHGLGFAGVLAELGLPRGAMLPALLGFNLGVEAGQLALVSLFLPLAFPMRGSPLYCRAAVGLGSALIALVGAIWLAERSLGLELRLG